MFTYKKEMVFIGKILPFVITLFLMGAFVVNAGHVPDGSHGGAPVPDGSHGADSATQGNQSIINPIDSRDVTTFILKIIDVVLVFLTPIIVLYIMYAGFLFVTARGNTEQVSKAHKALLWAVVGGVIVLGAKVIITVIENTVKAI